MPKNRPNSFENFFAEPFYYGDGYGYAVSAKDSREAVDKIIADLGYKEEDYGEDFVHRLKREIRENMKECFVTWQGFTDDDGVFGNGWVITSEKKWGQKRWRQVWSSDYNQHYVTYGHRYEPKADERGNRVNYSYSSNCHVCLTLHEQKDLSYKQGWDSAGGELADTKTQVIAVIDEIEQNRLDFGGENAFVDILESTLKTLRSKYE